MGDGAGRFGWRGARPTSRWRLRRTEAFALREVVEPHGLDRPVKHVLLPTAGGLWGDSDRPSHRTPKDSPRQVENIDPTYHVLT